MRHPIAFAATLTAGLALAAAAWAAAGHGDDKSDDDKPAAGAASMGMDSAATGPLMLFPLMNSERGKRVFADKGCVVCHSINGVGGEDAPPLDAAGMDLPMNPFEFAARMWAGAEAMVMMQQEELGGQIELDGQELADLIAFVHDPVAQSDFAIGDVPEAMRELIAHDD